MRPFAASGPQTPQLKCPAHHPLIVADLVPPVVQVEEDSSRPTRSSSQSSTPAPVSPLFPKEREPRFLWGIASTASFLEYTRRHSIRQTYLSFYKNTTRPDRICSWNALIQNRVDHPEDCQVAYAFFLGANPAGPTELLSCNDDCPPITTTTNSSILFGNQTVYNDTSIYPQIQEEDDVVYLNIRENQFGGKMETWFKYAIESIRNSTSPHQHSWWDFVVKADSDTLLFPPEFLQFAQTSLPLPAQRVYSGLRHDPHKFKRKRGTKFPSYCRRRELQGKHCNDYIVGQVEILSLDLAEYVVSPQCNHSKWRHPSSEDLSLGDYVWSYPGEPINFIPFDSPHNLWVHTRPTKKPTSFRRRWFHYRKSLTIRNLEPNKPRFLLMNIPYSGSLVLLFEAECWFKPEGSVGRCFDSYVSQRTPAIADQTVALLKEKSLLTDDFKKPALLWNRNSRPATSTLWVLRHPLHRMNAFFGEGGARTGRWIKPFQECFKSIHTWLEATLQGLPNSVLNNTTIEASCMGKKLEKALDSMHSYLQGVPRGFASTKSMPVHVIRFEHFIEDSSHLEATYSSSNEDGFWNERSPHVLEQLKKTQFPATTADTITLKQAACCQAKSEVWVYKTLIEQAVNLDEKSKRESLEYLAVECGRVTLDPSDWDCRSYLPSA